MSMVRGDSLIFDLTLHDVETEDITAIVFSCKKNGTDGTYIFQKTLEDGITETTEEGTYQVRVAPEDTAGVDAGRYVYDLEITLGDNVYTISFGDLDILQDVTNSDSGGDDPDDPEEEETIFDRVYPIGSVYISINDTNPGLLFGGSWTRIKDKFLLAAGDTYSLGEIGGEAEHTLTKPELPQIYGRVTYHGMTADGRGGTFTSSATGDFKPVTPQTVYKLFTTTNSGARSIGGVELDVGEDQPHNNMPPYVTVYIWYRTA